MVKKNTTDVNEDVPVKDETVSTEDSTIEHINNLIANTDEKEDFVVEEENNSYSPAEEKTDPKNEEKAVKKEHKESVKLAVKNETKKNIPQLKESRKPIIKETAKPAIKNNAEKPKFKPKTFKINKQKMERGLGAKMVKSHVRKTEKNSSMVWLWVGLAVVFLIVIAFILFRSNPIKQTSNTTIDAVAATVNGEAIYLKNIDMQYNALSPVQQQIYTKEFLLNQSIDELLLIQESKNMNIKVSGQEIKDELDNFMKQNKLTDTSLNDLLTQQGMTLSDLQLLIEKKIRVRDLLNETILANISISDDQIKQYYDNNSDKFKQPEKVTVSHILIVPKENVSLDQAKVLIIKINSSLNKTNFCDLVTKYTDDSGSKDTCGTYTFGRGEMVSEFENASFDMKINSTAIVETVYGWHLIKKLGYTPSALSSFDDVKDQISQTLHDMQAQKNFDAMLNRLRAQAVIVKYLAVANNITTNKIDTAENIVTSNATATTDNTAATLNLNDFAKCLTNHSVIFYGADTCQDCQNQKNLFSDSVQYIKYVDCTVQGQPQVQTKECQDAKISGYPTWSINGTLYPGSQTLDKLSRLTGCTLPTK